MGGIPSRFKQVELMNNLITILYGLALLFGHGCASDEQKFDNRELSAEHREVWLEAADYLNQKYTAEFEEDDSGISMSKYDSELDLQFAAYAYSPSHDYNDGEGWLITYQPAVEFWSNREWFQPRLLQLTIHELCHVLLIGHDEGNPSGGHC